MRAVLWLLALFAVAVAAALFAGNNQGSVTVFWPPYRVDLSFNLVLLLLFGVFLVLHLALRALATLLALPARARSWRGQRHERAMYMGLLETLSHLTAGRFARARKTAEGVLTQERAFTAREGDPPRTERLRAMAHLLAAEGAHALQDQAAREEHGQQALAHSVGRDATELREGLQLRMARWAFDDRDAALAQQRLDELPHGVGRRTLALRLRFKVARLAHRPQAALELARLLTKHRAFSEASARSIVRGLVLELVLAARDPAQLQQTWAQLEHEERVLPEAAISAAERLLALQGEATLSRQWLVPAWEALMRPGGAPSEEVRIRLVLVLEQSFAQTQGAPDADWLARIERAQQEQPADALLQYLAGVACLHLSLWGKAGSLLKQALAQRLDARIRRRAWRALALLAEQRDAPQEARDAWRQAAQE